MKKYTVILFTSLSLVFLSSCENFLNDYLDKAPEQGLTEEQVFSKKENFQSFFDAVYEGRKQFGGSSWYDYNIKTAHSLYFSFWDQKYTWDNMCDAADGGRTMENTLFKSGSCAAYVSKFVNDGKRRPILESMFTDIRICNMVFKNIHYLEANYDNPDYINDYLGQAHFIRAYCHLALFKIWGPMPYITKVIGANDQWDFPRLGKYETCLAIANDFDTAAMYFEKAGKMRRDNGDLKDVDQKRPTGVAAKAFKARALLYGASPQNNPGGTASYWDDAAKANWEAIQLALTYNYALQPTMADRKKNFCGADYTNEDLWAWTAGNQSWNNGNFQAIMPSMFVSTSSTFSGVCPTQNWVDKYETIWGDPLNSQADRDLAATLVTGTTKHFVDQNPYANRDPRMDQDIIFNQQSSMPGWTGGKAQIYYSVSGGVTTYSELLQYATYIGTTRTGYYMRKYNWGNSSKSTGSSIVSDPLCRLAELYLNYAEAVNEVYGPTTAPSYATMTAVQAINTIRTRAGMPGVLAAFTDTKDHFRPRIKNERDVELSFEGHHFFDIRRWLDAPAAYTNPLIAIDVEKLPAGYDPALFPTGFRYTRKELSSDRQVKWKDPMYYLPFTNEDNFKMKAFTPNIVW